MNTKKILLFGLPAILILVVAWWLISPLFIVTEVNEELPVQIEQQEESAQINIELEEEKPLDIIDEVTEVDESMPEEMEGKEMLLSGNFVDADRFHKGSGDVKVVDDILRFENFQVTNGPDLRIYLATDDTASDFVDLGVLKGSKGNQNYDIPEGTDLEKYDTVLVWCRAFSVLFATAELS